MLTVDPSQKKVVWILMAVLIGAICVTVLRVRPHTAPQAISAVAAEQSPSSSTGLNVTVRNLSRNPFRAPDAYALAQARSNAAELGMPMPESLGGEASKPDDRRTNGTLPPLRPAVISALPSATRAGDSPNNDSHDKPKQAFELMATIKSSQGYSAVLKSDDSIVRVVNVGDSLDGGYKVRALKPGCAVLSNGEETIVVKKPQL